MIRRVSTVVFLSLTAALATADPIKKAPKVDADKITKECADRFLKALLDGNAEEGLKYFATPFRGLHGEKLDSLDKFKREFDRKPPDGVELVLGEPIELAQLNAVLKKANQKEINEEMIKDYGEYLGTDGRIIEMKVMREGTVDLTRHLLVRIKEGKASIVGISSVNRN
jgi:hypothetical protein